MTAQGRALVIGILTTLAVGLGPAPVDGAPPSEADNPYDRFVALYDGLLADHTRPAARHGVRYRAVSYDSWAADPRHSRARAALLASDPAARESRAAKLAYWINAYNFLTITLIIRERERETIRNLGGFFTSPWRAHAWRIAGTRYSLHEIEHEILRPMGEPRIHFAINCAALSCPDLRAEAYRAERIDSQLDAQLEATLDNPTKGLRVVGDDRVEISKVMDWFREDFAGGDLHAWLARSRPNRIGPDTRIGFLDYDWRLNRPP